MQMLTCEKRRSCWDFNNDGIYLRGMWDFTVSSMGSFEWMVVIVVRFTVSGITLIMGPLVRQGNVVIAEFNQHSASNSKI
jgi:hypothetical protein